MISIKKGLDLPISGAITDAIIHDIAPQHPVAILGEDYQGLKPTMLVAEGDKVTPWRKAAFIICHYPSRIERACRF